MAGLKTRVILALLCAAALLLDTGVVSRAWYDIKVQAVISTPVSEPRVTVIDIDDRSLAAVGRWPWSRVELAALLSLLSLSDPALIAVDLFFPDASGDADQELLHVLSDPLFLVVTAFDFESDQRSGELPSRSDDQRARLNASTDHLMSANGWVGLFPELADSLDAARVGHVNISDSRDGVVRWLPGAIHADGRVIDSLPSQIVRRLSQDGDSSLSETRRHPIPYVFDPRGVNTVSAIAVLDGSAPQELLTGQVLLIGSSASGLADRVVTPMGYVVPGVTLQALVTEAWLSDQVWQESVVGSTVTLILAWLAAMGLVWVFLTLTRVRWLIGLLGVAGLVLVVNGLDLYWNARLWDPTPLVMVLVIGATLFAYRLYALQRETAQRVRDMFQSYVPSRVLETLLSGDIERFDRGERAQVTVLFADLIGFTRLAEHSDPEVLTQTVRDVLNALTEAILAHGGTVDKYMGDAVMAFWGAPLPDSAQETRAVECALAMQAAMRRLPYGLEVGIGINTGEATVGNMGSDFRHAYSVLGDSVNIAARLESQTRVLGCSILLGEATARGCEQATQSLGTVTVKGKEACIEVFCLQSA